MSLKRPVPKKFRPRSRSVDNDGYESGYHMIPSSVNSSRTSLLEDNTQGAVFKYDSESDWENTPSTAGPKYPPYLIKALRLQHEKSNLMPKFYRNYHATSTSQLSTASSAPELYHLLTIPEIHQVFGFRTSSDNKHSSIVTIFSIWNTIMGTSILTIPWAIHQAGFATAICLMLGSTALCLYTAWRILKIQSLHVSDQIVGSDPNSLISEIAPGNVICPVKVVQQVNESLMSSVSNVSTTQMGSSLYRTLWNLEYTVPIVLVFFLGPLINIKSPSFFTRFNSSGTLSVLFLIIFVFIKAWRWGINVDFKNSDSISYVSIFSLNFPATTGVLALSMFIHNIIITIMRNNRHQEHNGRDLSIAYLLVFLTYAAVGLIFYVTFPLAKSCIQDNLLNNFLRHDVLTLAARMFLLFQLTTVYPLITYMLRVQIFAALKKPPYPGFYQVLLLNTAIVTVCVLFAIFLPQIGTVLR
ncbi:sodium-coupled neutral amino acid transporter 9 [Diaphorina citri]|uniref:Sodium-coupled neutral amino acid transporter 9 n=1 Tax=Diaphorina citri TaxID=121845 RepID=A0A3Q0ILD2_DIACI|nr:sodium-coupled neutral amino acid transporter 9 [Diaphorina citri]